MDKILLLRNKLLEFDKFSILMRELTIFQHLELLNSLELNQDYVFRSFLLSWCVSGQVPEAINKDDFNIIINNVNKLNKFDDIIIKSGISADTKTRDPEECADSSILQILDTVGQHYHEDPLELAKKYSYRQISYLFVLAMNAKMDKIVLKGGKFDGKKEAPHLNARGMIVDLKTLPPEEQKKYHLRILKNAGVIK